MTGRLVTFAILLLVLSGCGGSSSGAGATSGGSAFRYDPSGAKVPGCAPAGKAIALPAGFPTTFPMPPGSAITRRGTQAGATTVRGIVPTRSFKDTAAFFPRELRRAGFKILYSEADPPRDAEGTYRGHGYAGRWTLEHIARCGTAVRFAAFAQQSPR